MKRPRIAGISREIQNSPNRETDDLRILEAVLAESAASGADARLLTPEEFDAEGLSGVDLALPMCESYPRLKRLESLIHPEGIRRGPRPSAVNDPRAVLRCYRSSMAPLLAACPAALFPPTEIRAVAEGAGRPPAGGAPEGWWIKRGDVHNTCDRDVVWIGSWEALGPVLDDFRSREITRYLVQPHVPGDLLKFYGVGPGGWFTWFYHDPASARRIPFHPAVLAEAAAAAAARLGLEIFGGDAIVRPEGGFALIDLNSWPSFARVRGEAAPVIAAHVLGKLAPEAASPLGGRTAGAGSRP